MVSSTSTTTISTTTNKTSFLSRFKNGVKRFARSAVAFVTNHKMKFAVLGVAVALIGIVPAIASIVVGAVSTVLSLVVSPLASLFGGGVVSALISAGATCIGVAAVEQAVSLVRRWRREPLPIFRIEPFARGNKLDEWRAREKDSCRENEKRPQLSVLTLDGDGGGVKGLWTLQILRRIEACTTYRIGLLFDVIGGTSGGGLIAVCLGLLNMKVEECEKVFN